MKYIPKHIFHFLFAFQIVHAQTYNLVNNPGFESQTKPVITSYLLCTQQTAGDEIVPGWITPLATTPDYWNSKHSSCDAAPIVLARTGEGRCSIIGALINNLDWQWYDQNYREYVQGNFTQSLVAGKEYLIKFHVALDKRCNLTTNDMGCYISADPIIYPYPVTLFLDPKYTEDQIKAACKWEDLKLCESCNCLLDFIPTPHIVNEKYITSRDGWVEISGTYTAKGGEKYITIGNFSKSGHTKDIEPDNYMITPSKHIEDHIAFFYLDDVSVEPMDSLVKQKELEQIGNYYLFLLDISNSMNHSGNLQLMKTEIKNFVDRIDSNSNIGMMVFADNCSTVLPFTRSKESNPQIDLIIDGLKAGRTTDGDLAISKACTYLDSLQIQSTCYLIIATDGIFTISSETKKKADSLLPKNHTSFWAIQFGKKENTSLKEMTQIIPHSWYEKVNKQTLPQVFEKIQPLHKKQEPNPNKVYYSW